MYSCFIYIYISFQRSIGALPPAAKLRADDDVSVGILGESVGRLGRHVCIYIYIERERDIYIYIHTHTHTHIHIYNYMYMYTYIYIY